MLMVDFQFKFESNFISNQAHLSRESNVNLGKTRSYDSVGNVLSVTKEIGGFIFTCDIESSQRNVSYLAKKFKISEEKFLISWVCTEALAKLAKKPIFLYLKENGLFREEIPLNKMTCLREGVRLSCIKTNNYDGYLAICCNQVSEK